MKRFAMTATLVALGTMTLMLAAPAWAEEKAGEAKKGNAAIAAFDSLSGLAGTWEGTGKDGKPMTLEFKVTSAGSAVVETMFPGAKHEMVNVYTVDGDKVAVTHYCAMGNQPHMQLKSIEKGTLAFEFISGGNLASRDEMHMDALAITIAGDRLTEKWDMYSDGKVTKSEVFEFSRKK